MSVPDTPPPTAARGPPGESADARRARARCLFISRLVLGAVYVLGVALAGFILYVLFTHNRSGLLFSFAIAGIFVGIAVPLTLHDLNMHLMHYVDPLQNHCMRVLWMVPIYAIQSWLALVYVHQSAYLEPMRACYESYCLYSFYQLVLGAAGGRGRLAIRLEERGREKGWDRAACPAPCCCLRGWKLGSRFVHRCTVGVYQFVFINTAVAILQLITTAAGTYHLGVWDFRYFYPWSSLFINCSQMTALYCLAYFYIFTHDWYDPIRPLFKLCASGARARARALRLRCAPCS